LRCIEYRSYNGILMLCPYIFVGFYNYARLVHRAGTNVIRLIYVQDENPAITDLSGPRCLADPFNNVVNPALVGDNLDHRLGQQRYLVFQAAINSRLSFLMTMPADVGNGET